MMFFKYGYLLKCEKNVKFQREVHKGVLNNVYPEQPLFY